MSSSEAVQGCAPRPQSATRLKRDADPCQSLDGGELIEEFEDLVVAEFLAASFKRHGVGTHVQAFARLVAERSGC